MKTDFDLIGVGVGPFNLSLAALLSPLKEVRSLFLEQKKTFNWHSEIMFKDSVMQTSYLKDLVTPLDPTNPHSFLNFLVQHGLFYAHLNTGRTQVTRREFETYCRWVCKNLGDQLAFETPVSQVEFKDGAFQVSAAGKIHTTKNICVGTGLSPWIPEFVTPYLSDTCLHAKSSELSTLNLTNKKVVIIGGGQTGLEVFRNAFKGQWGTPQKVSLVSRRHTLEPLDESPFTNEYFSPGYVKEFYGIESTAKPAIVHHQRFASDGNTPAYLQDLYTELFYLKHVDKTGEDIHILPQRRLMNMEKQGESYKLTMVNFFNGTTEHMEADVVILCTGFRNLIPKCLESLKNQIQFDQDERFQLDENFSVNWEHSATNKIYAMNFGRLIHGIAEPQTSLMAWRSGKIINDLLQKTVYPGVNSVDNFVQHGAFRDA